MKVGVLIDPLIGFITLLIDVSALSSMEHTDPVPHPVLQSYDTELLLPRDTVCVPVQPVVVVKRDSEPSPISFMGALRIPVSSLTCLTCMTGRFLSPPPPEGTFWPFSR